MQNNMENMIRCKCGNILSERDFCNHFPHCQIFKGEFRKFDNDLGSLLKEYSSDPSNLPIIKILFSQYINVIDRKIKKMNNQGIQNPNPMQNRIAQQNNSVNPADIPETMQNNFPSQNNPPVNDVFNPSNNPLSNAPSVKIQNQQANQQNPFSNPFNPPQQPPQKPIYAFSAPQKNDGMEVEDDIITCQICHSPETDYLYCCHAMCKDCLKKYAEQDFFNMKCKQCGELIDNEYKRQVLGNQYEEILKKNDERNNKILTEGTIECPKCKELISFEPGSNVDYKIRDDKNQIISREACEDYAKNRARCTCGENFCASCKTVPYHVGYTCEGFKKRQVAIKCRYDDAVITMANRGPEEDVCNNQDCLQKYSVACKKKLPCGHHCFGTINDVCPPCIDSECPSYKNNYDQDKDAYCNICFVEGLGSSPIVTLSCGHYVHFLCIKQRLEKKWVGPKITFNHCLCPVCNNWYECSNPTINALVQQFKVMYKEICDMSLKRLEFEGLAKEQKLTDPKSKWFGKKLEYALHRLCYYQCFKCHRPYFAGRRECGDGPQADAANPNKYNPQDCICGKCADLSGVAGITNCPKHGKDYIEYKCRFCCKVASWFCWSTTHFCEDCHKRQCAGDYVSKYPKEKLPKCNPATCEIKMAHPPNGEEFALGCSICRNFSENVKDF